MTLEDTQNGASQWPINIDQVGISDLRLPIVVLDKSREKQQVVARVTASVSLPKHFKGTHMSRFIEVLNEHRDGEFTLRTIPSVLRQLKKKLNAESAHMELTFPYFMEKKAPATGAKGLMDYDCTFSGEVNGATEDFVLAVTVPVASLCPCSKAISDYGAHNQRGTITISVRTRRSVTGGWDFIWIEEIIKIAESSCSSPVYSLLKRPDERHITMNMYDRPMFVEDIVRSTASELIADNRVVWFVVFVKNNESIHNHNAFAKIEWKRSGTI